MSSAPSVLQRHGQDEGPHRGAAPQLVVWPQSAVQVATVCRLCRDHRTPVIPHGTGTGLEGGTGAVTGGVSLDLTNMDKIRKGGTLAPRKEPDEKNRLK